MANFDVSNPEYNSVLRKLETTDRAHADVLNAALSVLINNDAFLKAVTEALILSKQDAQTGMGLSEANYTNEEKQKLHGIADNANAYTHPTHPAKANGLYKVTVDGQGHVSGATAVSKADITALGIASAEAAALTAGSGISVTQAANGSKSVGLSGASVVVSQTAPTVQAGEQVVWVVPPTT